MWGIGGGGASDVGIRVVRGEGVRSRGSIAWLPGSTSSMETGGEKIGKETWQWGEAKNLRMGEK